jgi:hypothetical protein
MSLIAITGTAFMQSQYAGTEILYPHATVFIVLIGFLCISLVIDRRLWLETLTAPLSPGQMRFHPIPQFASRISKKSIKRKSLPSTDCLFPLEDSCHLRSDIESTQYTNLLHHLAGIPDDRLFFPHISMRDKHQPERNTNEVPQLTKTHFSSLPHKALIQMAPRAEQNLSFSPGFIFVRLARGPPNLN